MLTNNQRLCVALSALAIGLLAGAIGADACDRFDPWPTDCRCECPHSPYWPTPGDCCCESEIHPSDPAFDCLGMACQDWR